MTFSAYATGLLDRRYSMKNEKGESIESPEEIFRRVAKKIASAEENYDSSQVEYWEDVFFGLMMDQKFIPNSPTIANAGNELGQLSGCFVVPIEDSMESIFDGMRNTALIHKSGGGTGFSFSNLRGKGDLVGSTGGVASGPVSFMEVYDKATDVIKQGGFRRGANMAILRCDHPDIDDFIDSKKDENVLNNFNISVALTSDFMYAVERDGEYDLICPRTKEAVGTRKAKEIFHKICENAWANGDPGIIFIDEINSKNPVSHLGDIESTNPCVVGDTIIGTTRGGIKIKDLVGQNPWVFCCDGKIVKIKKAFDVCKTRVDAEIWKVTTIGSNNQYYDFKATKEHLVMLRDGSFKKVCDLQENDRIMPFYQFKRNQKGYREIINTNGVYFSEAEFVCSEFHGFPKDGEIAHHIDGDKTNNDPDNLVWRESCSHNSEHMKGEQNPSVRFPERNVLRKLGYLDGKTGSENPNFRHDIDTNQIVKLRESGMSYYDISVLLGCSKYTVAKRYKESETVSCNHKVVSVSFCGYEDVYNMEVPVFHNFSADGHFVHNCGEQPLLPYESCNLGSINLSKLLKKRKGERNYSIDFDEVRRVTTIAVRFLDDVIDVNKFPLDEIGEKTRKTRKIGLGVMGFADALIQMGIPYNTEEALSVAGDFMKTIQSTAFEASENLGEEKGNFPAFKNSAYERSKYMRNACRTTIAPTGSLSIIAECSGGIEPIWDIEFTRKQADTVAQETNKYYLEYKDLWSEEKLSQVFVTALQISPEWHLRMQAVFQRYTDNAVSKTINLPEDSTVQDVKNIYWSSFEKDLKGVTIYRNNSRSEQVFSEVVEKNRPEKLPGQTYKVQVACGKMYVTVNSHDGKPWELFTQLGKGGNCASAQLEAISRLVSLLLRDNHEIGDIIEHLRFIRCQNAYRSFGEEHRWIWSCPDAIGSVLEKLDDNKTEGRQLKMVGVNTGLCPVCQGTLAFQEGCEKCLACGFSKC